MSSRATLNPLSVRVKKNNPPLNSDSISFVNMNSHPIHFKTVQNAFKKIISPIYGDQKDAIAKIKEGLDRTCEIMLKYENPIGIIIYKNILQNEYGLKKALELKTLFLLNPGKNSGNGFGSLLFRRIDQIAKEMGTKTVYCTASSKIQNSIKCALKNGYKVVKIVKQESESTLYLLSKNL